MKLKAAKLKTMKPGRHPDGAFGLYFNVKPSGSRSWVQRLVIEGQRRTFGIGPYPVVSLAEARDAAIDNVRKRRAGVNPIADRVRASVPTFGEAADTFIKLQAAGWKAGSRNESNWRGSLAHAAAIADRPIDAIGTHDVIAVLVPLWAAKPATGKVLRQRIAAIMDWARSTGHRTDNPADSRIDAALPRSAHKVEHRAAVAVSDVADVLRRVRAIDRPTWRGMKDAFEFMVLTASRTGETLGARFDEIDREGVWVVPSERMKGGRSHRVPLSAAALSVVERARERTGGSGLMFRSPTGKRIDDKGLRRVMSAIGCDATPHGFRSCFRDWCSESGIARELAEWSLAHRFMSDTEAAYARSDLLEKRAPVMDRWGRYATATPAPKVVSIGKRMTA